jgi:carboxylate-amine ligase
VEPITLVAENKWRAARDGLKANLIDLADDSERTAPEAVRALVEQSRPAAQELGCEPELDGIEALLQRGSGSDEQLAIYGDTDSLLAVAKWLAEETVGSL